MKFKLDENLPIEAKATLQELGYDVVTVWDESLSGAPDHTIAEYIVAENRALITLDLDFSNIRAYPPSQYPGMIVLRLKSQDKPTVLAYIRRFATALTHRTPANELWIVERRRIRFHSDIEQ